MKAFRCVRATEKIGICRIFHVLRGPVMEQNDISSRIVFADRGKVNVEKGVEFAKI